MAVRLRKLPPSIFQRFFRTETAGGSVLLLFGIAALALANSPLAAPYVGIWRTLLTVGIADYSLSLTLHLETASVGAANLGICPLARGWDRGRHCPEDCLRFS